jgi:hypothetical protein
MSVPQRWVLAAGLLLFAVAGAFPPWTKYCSDFQGDAVGWQLIEFESAGHSLILSPPVWSKFPGNPKYFTRIDTANLLVIWTAISAATGAGIVAAGALRRRSI